MAAWLPKPLARKRATPEGPGTLKVETPTFALTLIAVVVILTLLQFMPVLVFPQIILGGLFMPRDQMPEVLYAISDWLPLSYAIDAVNAVTAGEEGWDLWRPLLIVVAFAVGCLVLASLTLRRRTPERALG